MRKRQINRVYKMKILFLLPLFLLYGCVSTQKTASLQKHKNVVRPKITDDVLVFKDIQQVDLDKDGIKDIVAVYAASTNTTGVKIIKVTRDTGQVIFKRTFDTPNTKLLVQNDIPTLVVNYTTKGRLKSTFYWDGKDFIQAIK